MGARLAVSTHPTAELGVSPAGVDLLTERNLRPGVAAALAGPSSVTNYTVEALRVRVRVVRGRGPGRPPSREGERRPRAGLPGQARRAAQVDTRRGSLAPKEVRKVELRSWLPAAAEGYRGRSDDLELEWSARGAGS